jgi:LysM repeat protein
MAGHHHAQPQGMMTKTKAAVVLTVVLVALALVGLYTATRHTSTSAANDGGKPVSALSTPAPSSSLPSNESTAASPINTPASSPAGSSSPALSPGASVAPLTYVVAPGDNLTVIAAWFHLHGYGQLYDENKAVIGADPDLIHPGQRITISSGGVTTSN